MWELSAGRAIRSQSANAAANRPWGTTANNLADRSASSTSGSNNTRAISASSNTLSFAAAAMDCWYSPKRLRALALASPSSLSNRSTNSSVTSTTRWAANASSAG